MSYRPAPTHSFILPCWVTLFVLYRRGWSLACVPLKFSNQDTFAKYNQVSKGACSVAASYKPPMLVTRARLPACAVVIVSTKTAIWEVCSGGTEETSREDTSNIYIHIYIYISIYVYPYLYLFPPFLFSPIFPHHARSTILFTSLYIDPPISIPPSLSLYLSFSLILYISFFCTFLSAPIYRFLSIHFHFSLSHLHCRQSFLHICINTNKYIYIYICIYIFVFIYLFIVIIKIVRLHRFQWVSSLVPRSGIW